MDKDQQGDTVQNMPRAKQRVSAADKRRADLLKRAEQRRHDIAVELDNSQEVLTRARTFVRKYDDITVERAEAQSFWNDLLAVFGIDRRAAGVEFEWPARRIDTGGMGRIDVYWPRMMLAEHKSAGQKFDAALAQADAYEIDESDAPRLTVVCDFVRFFIRDNHTGRSTEFDLSDLPDKLGWFGPLVHDELTELSPQRPVDVKAAEKMAALHDELRAAGYTGHNLRVLMTRLLFCFFADDARIWPHGKLDTYLRSAPPQFAGAALAQLFEVLNTPPDERSAMLADDLATFPYVNGGLFAENLPITNLNADLLDTLVATSEEVDWSAVSPAVFGAMFQGVMDAVERHDLGAHYTSEENILRVIEPLFLDDLYQDIERATTVAALERIWQRMARLRFLDPAAGCGNFLVVSYREMRRVERHLMDKLRTLAKGDPRHVKNYPWVQGQRYLDNAAATRLRVSQFYGIEIDEWPANIAQVAMWLTDHLANMELEDQFGGHQTRLPLVDTAHIAVGNALRMDWNDVLGDDRADYILGNPPFLGSNMQDTEQKADVKAVWGGGRGTGTLDYVTCWFKKAAEYIDGTDTRVAFVATNSVTQGEQPAVIWTPLYEADMHIDFAHRSFRWTNEARGKAAVHVVIIGFSQGKKPGTKSLWTYPDVNAAGVLTHVPTINAYLVPAAEVLIKNRRQPLAGKVVQEMSAGAKATDGGHLFLTTDEANEVRVSDPVAAQYLRRVIGAQELIQGGERWCLWLVDVSPEVIRSSPVLRDRAAKVRAMREASTKAATVESAKTPTLFQEHWKQPSTTYLAVPSVSSSSRRYTPVAQMAADVIATNLLLAIPGADLVTLGVLSSYVFTVWNAAVSGRLKSDYRVSAEVTYNNFPWPEMDEAGRQAVTTAAQAVLTARAAHPNATLADLYDPLTMPANLVKAHKQLDRAVLSLYGMTRSPSDADILAKLFERYVELTTAEAQS